MDVYDRAFFDELDDGADRSARVVLPILLEFFDVGSVVDVGCGRGGWLAIWRDMGVTDVVGVDGDYVDTSRLAIPVDRFQARDLREPLRLSRRFDLVMSLEVAEHLAPEHAESFVDSLVRLGPAVLFSAAIPGQGGRHHVNEQWPEYWAELFAAHDYVPVDLIRRRIWRDPSVDWWYAQNVLLYAHQEWLQSVPRLKQEHDLMGTDQLSLVHPQKYDELIQWAAGLWETTSG